MKILLCIYLIICLVVPSWGAWGFGASDSGKVLLRDVQVLTLQAGKMTTGRRSSPVPQLNCVGGSARGKFNPQVVQCYNRGSDGNDIQWECKADMDNAYRFGSVEVVCEGYDYPDDPFILKGSCGLEYTLDNTMEGHEKQHNYGYGSNSYGSNSYGHNSHHKQSKSYFDKSSYGGFGDLIVLFVIGIIIYAMYKTCLSGSQEMGDRQYSTTNDDRPSGYPGSGGGWFNPRSAPNPSGTAYDRGYPDASCGGAGAQANRPGTGGFWTGMATGGLMGYMFGNRGGGYNYNRGGYGGSGWSSGGGSSWGGGGGSSMGGSTTSGSTGTRTASGFGGTRRR